MSLQQKVFRYDGRRLILHVFLRMCIARGVTALAPSWGSCICNCELSRLKASLAVHVPLVAGVQVITSF